MPSADLVPPEQGVHVALGTRDLSRGELVEIAEEVDALGFGGLWITESSGRDAFSVLTEVALRTRKVHLGTGIVNTYGRTPATLAMAAASLAEVASGRTVNLGIGASSKAIVEGFHGISFGSPAKRMEEALQIIRRALSGEKIQHRGEHFNLDGRFRLEAPSQSDRVRLYASALSPRMVRVVREHADGWLGIWVSKSKFALLRQQLTEDVGSSSSPPSLAAYLYSFTGDDERGRQLLRSALARYIAGSGAAYTRLFCSYGYQKEVNDVLEAWKVGDRRSSSAAVTDEMIDDLCILGGPTAVAEQISLFRRIGIELPILRFPDGLPSAEMVDMLRGAARSLTQRNSAEGGQE